MPPLYPQPTTRSPPADPLHLVALMETNKTLKEIQAPVVDLDQPIITEKELRQVEDELGKSRVSEDVLRKSAESFKSLGKRELALEKAKSAKKDEEIAELKRQLANAQTDARQNLLNTKDLKVTLRNIAVRNLKVKEVASLLPAGDEIDVMDLTAMESLLPEEVDVGRTKFLSPRPPPTEIKRELRFGNPGKKTKRGRSLNQTVG